MRVSLSVSLVENSSPFFLFYILIREKQVGQCKQSVGSMERAAEDWDKKVF